MTAPQKPAWWRPGLTPEDTAIWEAAERCANAAPEIRPGDDVALRLKTLYADFPSWLRERRAGRESHHPAA